MDWWIFDFNVVLLAVATLLLLSVFASKASYKLGVPGLLLFLTIGMLAGSEGIGGIVFDDYQVAQLVGVIALAYILFAGGLDTHWQSIRPVLGAGAALATVGVVLTGVITGLAAVWLIGLSPLEGFLLAAIVSSTDAAAVFSVLRSRSLRLQRPLKPLLELESGSNDPMAVFLTVGLISLLMNPGDSPLSLGYFLALQALVGGAVGLGAGRLLVFVLNRLHLDYDGLYPVLTLAAALLIYAGTAALGGSGFLAVYLAGLMLGKYEFVHKRSITRFHDGMAWLMQIGMFLTLGLLVFPSELLAVAVPSLLLSFVLIFIARPVAVFLTMIPVKMPLPQKSFVSWVGLKGAVPVVLATFPLLAGVPEANLIFNVVFFVVLTSTLVQGTSIPLVARLLRIQAKPEPAGAAQEPDRLREPPSINARVSRQQEIHLSVNSPAVGKQIAEIGLPSNALIIALNRDDRTMVPAGTTTLRPGDQLVMVIEDEAAEAVQSLLHGRDGASPPGERVFGETRRQ